MTREEIFKRAKELKKEDAVLEKQQDILHEEAQELQKELMKTATIETGTVFKYKTQVIYLSTIECKRTNKGDWYYDWDLCYTFNLINCDGLKTNIAIFTDLIEKDLKTKIQLKELVLNEEELETKKQNFDWPKEIHAESIRAYQEIKTNNETLYDYIIECHEPEKPRSSILEKRYYRVQTPTHINDLHRKDWFIRPEIIKEGDDILEGSRRYKRTTTAKEDFVKFKLYTKSRYKFSQTNKYTYVSKVKEEDLLETLLDFN
jgi:hypothetical protein